MFSILRTVFCILSVLCVAAIFPMGIFLGWAYCIALAAAAVIFGFLMVFFKNGAHVKETPAPTTDFMNSDEENERILRERKEEQNRFSEREEE